MNETMMNALAALFEKHRIVFWYCEDPLLVADFEACAMPTVEKRDITGHPLATKVEVLLERPKDKFLLFCRGELPDRRPSRECRIPDGQGFVAGDGSWTWTGSDTCHQIVHGILRRRQACSGTEEQVEGRWGREP